MRLLLFIALIGRFCFVNVTPDDPPPGEMGPAMLIVGEASQYPSTTNFSQSILLHDGWNLVSWHIVPMDNVGPELQFFEILDPNNPNNNWFWNNAGQLCHWNSQLYYGPGGSLPGGTEWDLNYAYYIRLTTPHPWEFTDKPLMTLDEVTDIRPSSAWSHNDQIGSPFANYWFFMGYAAPGYCKLASVPVIGVNPTNGDPANYSYEGPFHWLIWYDSRIIPPPGFPVYNLKIIKTDDGKCYIPSKKWDNIVTLEPGKGYFLGFSDSLSYTFEGWQNWSQWRDEYCVPPDPKESQQSLCSGSHFQFQPYTHWSYPVYIDTVDLAQTPLSGGDQIGVFDGDLCVGAVTYDGAFPLVIACWEDDIATPEEVDGYIFSNPMTFKWFDVSENTEAIFELPPITQAVDDPVAPNHSGFGQGLYGQRSFMEGILNLLQLPQEFKLGQNYPNPFNSSTVIPLELPQRSKVKIEVFNLKGQRVGYVYESIENTAYSRVYYDASRLASGVYFCRVTAEGMEREGKFSGVSKLVLLK